MKISGHRVVAAMIGAAAVLLAFGPAFAQTVQLSDTVSPEALKLPTFGDLPPAQTLPLQIWFKPRNQAQLTALLAAQQNPSSKQYHKWLTPKEYTKRFGVTQAEFDKVSDWLTSEGFQVTGGSPAEGYLKFNGSAVSVSHTFGTRIAKFSSDGSKFGNLSAPQIPAEYGNLVGTITGLDNLHASKAMTTGHVTHPVTGVGPQSRLQNSTSGNDPVTLAMIGQEPDVTIPGHGTHLGPSDFYTFYDETPLKNAGTTGTGCIAIVGDSDFVPGPIQSFNNQFGLTDNSASIVKVLVNGTNPGVNSDETETLLDLEWAHAVAPSATIKYFLGDGSQQTPNGPIVDGLNSAVNDGTCAVINISFGLCGGSAGFYTSTIGTIVTKAQVQGQTIMVSSGDDGAAGIIFNGIRCTTGNSANVNELASNPLITSVGGTSFSSSAFNGSGVITGHITERVWDDPNDGIGNGGATGGGASAFFSKPSFQNGLTPGDNARDQPDVALLASPNFPGSFYYDDDGSSGGVLSVIGGTSISAPMWSGIVDLLVQKSGGKVGSINQRVYSIASGGQAAAGFFDVTSGNNSFNGVTGFSAVTGYDQSTGWGTADIDKFVTAYIGSSASPTPTATATPTATPTSSGTPTRTATPTPTATPTTTPTPTATPTPKVSAVVKISPASVNFGKVKIGSGKAKTVSLTNTAKKGGPSVTFSGGSISGSGEFSGSTNCSGAVPPKGKCNVTVGFTPTSAGAVSATVTINSNASNPTRFSVSGTGVAAKR